MQTLKGKYTQLGETPTERLRNFLNPTLDILEMLQNGETSQEDIEYMESQAKQINVEDISTYLDDAETLIYDDYKKPWDDLIKK
jgi:NADH:ubiquinone oxidoreductase subunit F (NADH-binding)